MAASARQPEQVSRIEHGDIDRAQIDTLRKYVEARVQRWENGVHNVHTRGFGLGRTQHVFGSSQCFQGLEAGSSPTSGTVFPQVRGLFGPGLLTKSPKVLIRV
ncbi:hypothetical protein [Arthrobacter methylotrophus]|uniref:hypothetical protein n=1 Tax=Arthrobacter methylotrophus TaxID=121291 RepID=UPI0031E5BF0D